MLRTGIASVSYRNSSSQDIIVAAQNSGLQGIEWSADAHAPHGEIRTAEALMIATLRAGLTITSYASFFRIGDSDNKSFAAVLESARVLNAPIVRVWASTQAGDSLSEDTLIKTQMANAKILADMAGHCGVTLSLEAHEHSQINTYTSLATLVNAVNHPFFQVCWSPLPKMSSEEQLEGLKLLAPQINLIHVRNWTSTYDRKSLSTNKETWTAIINILKAKDQTTASDHWTLLEYLENEDIQTLKKEATLLSDMTA